jgi:PAS/PAC sensor signal transduction histidine kinase
MDSIKDRFKQYQDAIEASNIVSKTDINGIITFVNDEFCKISGYSREELIGKNHNIVRHPDVSVQTFVRLWETILSKKVHKGTIRNLSKDGRSFYLNTTIIPIVDLNGEIEEFIAIRYDVTDMINLNNELETTKRQLLNLNENLENRVAEQTAKLRNLNENLENLVKSEIKKNEEKTQMLFFQSRLASMGEMIANIAHQWRQPLNELSITLFKLKDSSKFETNYEHAKRIIKTMSATIDDFMGFFDINRTQEIFSPIVSVENAIKILSGTLEKERIKIELKSNTKAMICGFSSELSQAIIVLLTNAKDALQNIDDKFIFINLREDGEFILININDNAGGIPEGIMCKIFEPYFTTKHPSQGTGIGLYMLKMIVEKMGGNVAVSNNNFGANFEIRLPIIKDNNE